MHPDFRLGVRDATPLLIGVVPFAMVAGIVAIEVGLTPVQAVGMSLVVFAGASQLAALELLGETANLGVIVFTAVVINLRMSMYSASLAPHLLEYSRKTRGVLAYFLTDQAYALSVAKYETDDVDDKRWYYTGVAGSIWAVWMIATVFGVVVGASVPEAWGLSFAVPLIFLAILVPVLSDYPRMVAALTGGVIAVLAAGAPFNLGLPVGAVAGIAAGLTTEAFTNR